MSEIRELSFCELKRKDIVSVGDGRKLGHLVDLVFSSNGRVQGIVAPFGKKFLCFHAQEVYIPYCNIKTIGEDIILVDIDPQLGGGRNYRQNESYKEFPNKSNASKKSEESANGYDCDGRCDKCMLFDCENRWKTRNSVYVDNAPYK